MISLKLHTGLANEQENASYHSYDKIPIAMITAATVALDSSD